MGSKLLGKNKVSQEEVLESENTLAMGSAICFHSDPWGDGTCFSPGKAGPLTIVLFTA
jgi:hypothetical protein